MTDYTLDTCQKFTWNQETNEHIKLFNWRMTKESLLQTLPSVAVHCYFKDRKGTVFYKGNHTHTLMAKSTEFRISNTWC
jgi:hypothetical protein